MPTDEDRDGRDDELAAMAAGQWFSDEMEPCPCCGAYVPQDELIALIGTRPVCSACRTKEQQRRLDEAMDAASWPLGLS
jgi:hypothetical protein